MLNLNGSLRTLFCLSLLASGFGCGKNDDKAPGSSIVDFTKNPSMQFYAASGGFISATFYDLALTAGTIKKYSSTTASPTPSVEKELTMSSTLKSSLSTKLKSVTIKTFAACTAAVCKAGRASNWIGIESPKPSRYYFAYEGDCSCTSDEGNQASVPYAQLNAIYKEVSTSL